MTYLVPFLRRFSHICPLNASAFLCQFRFGQRRSCGQPDHIYDSPSKPAKLNDTTFKKKPSLSIRRSNSLTANRWRTVWKTFMKNNLKNFERFYKDMPFSNLYINIYDANTTKFLNILSMLSNWTSKFQLNASYTLCISISFMFTKSFNFLLEDY